MKKITARGSLRKKYILSAAVLFLFSITMAQQQENLSVPAPKGVLVFTGMALPNGNQVDRYTVERSYDKKRWEQLTEMRSPADWNAFQAAFNNWKPDFGFQGEPPLEVLQAGWQKCEAAGVIDSLGYWSPLTGIRLAAGIAYYDQTVEKEKKVWHRVRAYKGGKMVSESISYPVQYPFLPRYDPITLSEKAVNRYYYYMQWRSKGDAPAPYFEVRYYENKELKEAKGVMARYKVDNSTYYIFQDTIANLTGERQYFLNPLDMYGNRGAATEIVFVSQTSAKANYFSKANAHTLEQGYGVRIHWELNNPEILKSITLFKSDSFDGKEYMPVATLPATDTAYIDADVVPDKMYYYYLETESAQHDKPLKSNIFFANAYDKHPPVPPVIRGGASGGKEVRLEIEANDIHLAGVRVYRSNGIAPELQPISDILPLHDNVALFTDTSSVLRGDRGYLYAATTVNTSAVESGFSNRLTVVPDIKTVPPSPNQLTAYLNDEEAVQLLWEDVQAWHLHIRGYAVYRRELPDGSFEPLLPKDSLVLGQAFADKTVIEDKAYEYAVQTVDYFGGTSETMAQTTIYIQIKQLPAPPEITLRQEMGKVIAEWYKMTDEDLWETNLYRYQRGGKEQLLKRFTSRDEPYFEDDSVAKGELYFYFTTFTDGNRRESLRSPEKSIRVK